MDTNVLIDLIIMACGVYMVYGAISMKLTSTIPPTLLGKGVNLACAKDIPGYIKKMFPPTLIVGILTILCGLIGTLGLLNSIVYAQSIISLVFLIVIIGYGYILVNAQKKYLMK